MIKREMQIRKVCIKSTQCTCGREYIKPKNVL